MASQATDNTGKRIGEMMSNNNIREYEIIGKGDLVMLRTLVETDRDHHKRWQTQGEWLLLDAPWARIVSEEEQKQDDSTKKPSLLDDSIPKKRAIIATLDNKPIGTVSRYRQRDESLVRFVGISIAEDDYLNRGYGTEALKLWVNHLFANSDFHKLCLDTWSFNPRMMRVAEKVGFEFEGCQREMQFWQGEWLGFMHYGMLREEWERIQQGKL
jgi:RimJ/RimL family protein N-acetyltransferase